MAIHSLNKGNTIKVKGRRWQFVKSQSDLEINACQLHSNSAGGSAFVTSAEKPVFRPLLGERLRVIKPHYYEERVTPRREQARAVLSTTLQGRSGGTGDAEHNAVKFWGGSVFKERSLGEAPRGGIAAKHRWRESSQTEGPAPALGPSEAFLNLSGLGKVGIIITLGPHPKWTPYTRPHPSPGLPASTGERGIAAERRLSLPVPARAHTRKPLAFSTPGGSWQLLSGLGPGVRIPFLVSHT